MMRKLTVAGVLAGALLLGPPAQGPAQALSGLQSATVATEGVTEIRRRGFRGRHFRGRHFRGHRFHRRHWRHRGWHHRRWHRRHWRRRWHRRHYFYGGYYPYYGYHYSHRRSCRRLKLRAIWTGSSYWWWRYRVCRSRYY